MTSPGGGRSCFTKNRFPAVSYTHLDVYKRQVGDRPHSGARVGKRFLHRRGVQVHGFVVQGKLGQTEVEDLRVSALGDKDVRSLDVAVDDASGCLLYTSRCV